MRVVGGLEERQCAVGWERGVEGDYAGGRRRLFCLQLISEENIQPGAWDQAEPSLPLVRYVFVF